MNVDCIVARYFDASALVKLVANEPGEEPGRDALRSYYHAYSNQYATSHSVTETFGVFKSKFLRSQISAENYIKYVKDFVRTIVGGNLRIDDEVSLLSPDVVSEAERLMKTHNIDFLDCFQIVTILKGQHRMFCGESSPLLVTADRGLALAARAEGLQVWECISEPVPRR